MNAPVVVPKNARYHDKLDKQHPVKEKNVLLDSLFEHLNIYDQFLTSTKPWQTRTTITAYTLVMLIAPGKSRFKRDDVKIAVPKIRFDGKNEERKPPGIWVMR